MYFLRLQWHDKLLLHVVCTFKSETLFINSSTVEENILHNSY